MAVVLSVAATGNEEIDGLLWGTQWSGTVAYSFADSANDYAANYGYGEPLDPGFSQIAAPLQSVVNYAIALIAGYTNIAVAYAGTGNADIMVAQSPVANPTSWAYSPDASYTEGGDVWFGTTNDYSLAASGNYTFQTTLSVLGIAFGLKGSQDLGGVSSTPLPPAHDDVEFSIMSPLSYVGAPDTGYVNETNGFAQTYMANDIVALQTLYGANFSTHSENTVYSWDPNSGQEFINGIGQLTPADNRVFETIWDGNGVDTYDLSNYTTSVAINLNPGASSLISSTQLAYLGEGSYAQGNVYNANLFDNDARSYIENATGGSGDDTLIGNAVANVLNGGAGNDVLTGGGGNDVLIGGSGTDVAVYSGSRSDYAISFNIATQTFTVVDQRSGSPDGTDTVTGVENLQFSDQTIASSTLAGPPDTTPPTLTTLTNQFYQPTSIDGAVATFLVTAADNVDGTDLVVFTEGNKEVYSGDTFGLGAHTIMASATDAAGNTSSENFVITVAIDTGPVLGVSNFTAIHNQVFNGSSLFSYSDPFGSAATQYDVWDAGSNGGHFLLNGTTLGANQHNIFMAAQLSQLTYESGFGADTLYVRANDGLVWGGWSNAFTVTSQPNHAPVVTASDFSATHGQNIAAASLFSVSDADTDMITAFRFWDSTADATSGHFLVNGVSQGGNQNIDVSAAQLASTTFQSGAVSDDLWVQAYDGVAWSSWKEFHVNPPFNHAPVVTASDFSATHGQNIAAASLFSVSDADTDTITAFRFWDSTADATSGHFVVNGVSQGGNQNIDVSAAQLASTTFQSGAVSDDLWVQAYDGVAWSSWKEFHVNPPFNHAPVVTASDFSATHGQNIAAASLFSVSDADTDTITAFRFWDSTADATSGHFVVNGVSQGGNQNIDVSAAQLASTTFQSGSGSDDLWVQGFDGTTWSNWKEFHVNAPVDHAPVVAAPDFNATHGQNIAAASLFSVTDADADSIPKYQLWDSTADAASGHWSVGGTAQGANTAIDVTAAQLASTTFHGGTITDDLWVRANDGIQWSQWQEFHWIV